MGTNSWSETDFAFGTSVAQPSNGVFNSDINIDKNFPAVEFTGTEPNAIYQEVREVSGDFYLQVSNATYNGTNWVCKDTSLPAYAIRRKSAGSVEFVKSPATIGNITWTVAFTIDVNGIPSNPNDVDGSVSAAADSSATVPVTFLTPFPTACTSVELTPMVGSFSGQALSAVLVGAPTKTGFTLAVSGGDIGTTCTVYWRAKGN